MNRRRLFIVGVLAAALLCVWLLFTTKTPAPHGTPMAPVRTTGGLVRGARAEGLDVYLGVPYARAPVGARRFRPPEPPLPWRGTRDAFAFGSFCPQVFDPVVIEDPHEPLSDEDCLTLNVWAPAAPGPPRAVMVYLHGGGFIEGASKERLYHGDAIARTGDVVVVTLNYRLGLLGFFDFSAIGGAAYAGSADLGIQDQLLALRWVRENIAAFGGDARNVTVLGESAGGTSVLALLGVDAPRDYYDRAIVMSGSPLHSATNTRNIANLIKTKTGISWPFVWRWMPARLLMYVQRKVLDAVGQPLADMVFAPTHGADYVVKRDAVAAAAAGGTKGIDLLIGTMADELTYWSFYDTPTSHLCEQTVAANLFTVIDPRVAPQVRALYDLYAKTPRRGSTREGDVILAMGGDYVFRAPALTLAAQQAALANVRTYRVDYPVNLPAQPCQNGRSPHGGELPFLFGRVDEQTGWNFIGMARDARDAADRRHLSDQMIRAWTNFAKTGDPNGGDLPAWPAFDATSQPTLVFSANSHLEHAPFAAEYRAMAEFMKGFSVFDAFR
jgi:para-nitrobenzyl esterase